ncbi:MAG: cell wall hydrolase [Pseudomonadales bacterium]
MIRIMGATLSALLLVLTGCSNPSKPAAKTAQAEAPRAAAVNARELHCLALSMYWEAKAEGPRGMQAVGQVVMNRVAHERFPNSACQVVYDGGEKPPCQFSWYCDGKSDQPTEAANWAEAQRIARLLLTDPPADITRGGLFFHATWMKNPWRIPRTKTVTVGKHVFYKL